MMKEGAKVTAESSIRSKRYVKSCRFSCCIGGLIARQANVARDPAKKQQTSLTGGGGTVELEFQ
jgi:hypothetical protein